MHRGPRRGGGAGAALHHRRQVGRRGATAAADRRDTEFGDEAVQVLGQVLRGQVVVHLAVDHRRETRVGDAGDGDAAGRREMAQGLAHLDGTGGAVEADDVDLHGVEDGEGSADLGARQHAAGQLDRDLGLQRDEPVQRHHGAPGAVDRRLDREQVELRLDQQEVDAAFEQPERLLLVGVPELGERDVPEGGELGARPHGAGDPAGALGRGELVADGAGELGRPPRELARPVAQSVLGQHDRGRAEGVGLDDVAADLEERAVDLGHQVGARLDEPLVAPLELGTAEVVGAEPEQLQIRPHGAVEDDDAARQRLQVRGRGRVEPSEKLRGGGHHPYRIPAAHPASGTAPVASGLVGPRIYTKKGDDGTTGLLFGGRVRKDSWRIELNGAVDEAQAAIGLARAETAPGTEANERLTTLARDLYVLMAEVATAPANRQKLQAGSTLVTADMVARLEAAIDDLLARFDMPSDFTVPGKNRVAAALDLARTIVRRAERIAVAEPVEGSFVVAYLNRLSDLLWAMARWQEGPEHTLSKG